MTHAESVRDAPARWPLDDEPHVERWCAYADEARGDGVFEALRRRFVQLRCPIAAGISQHDAYRRATLRGEFEAAEAFAPGLALERPDALELRIVQTLAGRVPAIVAETRADFVTLVQALTARHEPADVPASMGACLVSGLTNWDRVARHRAQWTADVGPQAASAAAWAEELRRLAPRKALYQDRVMLLSRGPYAGVPACDVGLDERTWLDRSLIVRQEHELTHYFTWRVFGAMQNHLRDELLADYVGLLRGCGEYRADVAQRVLGIDADGVCRPDARLRIYHGDAPVGDVDADMATLGRVAARATRALASVAASCGARAADLEVLARIVSTLYPRSLEDLALLDGGTLLDGASADLALGDLDAWLSSDSARTTRLASADRTPGDSTPDSAGVVEASASASDSESDSASVASGRNAARTRADKRSSG